jgi:hypothetical protein
MFYYDNKEKSEGDETLSSLFPLQAVGRYTVKKELAVFPSPTVMSLIKLFLGGNNLVFPAQREFGQ